MQARINKLAFLIIKLNYHLWPVYLKTNSVFISAGKKHI